MTTPKRNESVAPVRIDVLAVIDEAICSAESDYVPESHEIRQMHAARAVVAEMIYQRDALRGEVSRLRERASECEKVLAIVLGGMLSGAVKSKPLMSREGSDYTVGSLQELIEKTLTANLEPPTDGR